MANHGKNVTNGNDGNADNGKHDSHASHDSHPAPPPERLLPPRGDYQTLLSFQKADRIANIAICLIHQTNYLIDQQVRRLEQEFLEQGGLRERMTRARIAYRNGK
jgi:four helix bundle suffix protein